MTVQRSLFDLPPTPARRGSHYARLSSSPRLQRVLAVLRRGGWWGTRALVVEADVCAVNSAITELRENGIEISTRCVGQGRYEYRLAGGTR